MTSKIAQVSEILHGSHVLGNTATQGLAAYHDAKKCVNACRMASKQRAFETIRKATTNYRIIISYNETGFRFFRPDTKQELVISY